MITENSILTGMNGSTYRLGTQIGVGGEGVVYAVQGTQLVAKIYKNVDPDIEGKLRYMVHHPIPQVVDQNGNPILNAAWPQDLLYDGSRQFVGYVMPRIESGVEIFQVERGCTNPKVRAKFSNYSWRLNVLVARNLAASVNILHKQGYVLGDMNSKNFLVNTDGSISLLDTDSIDMTDPNTGKHYKCCVGMEDYLPPELQGRNLRSSNARYTPQTDDFALAIHIFQLLMNNYHPFSGKQTVVKSSSSACGRMQQIAEGKCPYLHTYPDLTIPMGAPRLEHTVPDYVIRCFRSTFDYNGTNAFAKAMSRTTAAQWTDVLRQLLRECDTPGGLVRCQRDPSHYYLRSMGSCGMCRAQGIGTSSGGGIIPPVVPPKPAPKPKRKWSGWLILLLLVLAVYFLPSLAEYREPEPVVFTSGSVMVPDSVRELVAQGTPDRHWYHDGSKADMYFEDDLERCRIYINNSDVAEFVSVVDYNSSRNPVKHVLYDGQGTVLRTDVYDYDANGNALACHTYLGTEEDGNLAEVTSFTYQSDGRDLTVETRAGDRTIVYSGVSEYDENGNELYRYSEKNGSSGQTQYDAEGNVISHIGYEKDGRISYWTQYQYNAAGQESGGAYFNADGTIQSSWVVRYKQDGRRDCEVRYDSENEISDTSYIIYGPRDEEMGSRSYSAYDYTSIYEYFSTINGVTLRGISSFESGDYKSKGVSIYDLMGRYIENSSYDETGSLISRSVYTVDQYGYDTGHTYSYYESDGTVSVTVYDAQGEEISTKHYDAQGNEIRKD